MINIFLSYSTDDIKKVDMLQKYFEEGGQITCWNYKKNTNYLQEIAPDVASAIENADYFFLFWSMSVSKKIAWIEHEFRIGDNLEKAYRNAGDTNAFVRIILLDNTPLPRELSGKRYISVQSTQDLKGLKAGILAAGQRVHDWFDQRPSKNMNQSITSLMTPKDELLHLSDDSLLVDAFIQMETADVRHLVITDDKEQIAGFMSQRDIKKRIPPKLSHIRRVGGSVDVVQYQKDIARAGKTPINKVMTQFHRLIYLEDDATVVQALDTLLGEYEFGRISAIPVINQKIAVGVISYMDLLCKLDLPDENVAKWKKQDNLFWVYGDDDVGDVDMIMKQAGVRHMPILDEDNNLIGMINDVTMLWILHPAFRLHTYAVKEFMQPIIHDTSYLRDEDKLTEVVSKLFCIDKDITALPVVDDTNGSRKLTGILSYIDILRAIRVSYL